MNKTYPYQSYKSVFDYINSIMFFIDSLQRINHAPTSCMNLFFLSCVFWYFQSATSVSLELPLASLICLKSYYAISPRRWQDWSASSASMGCLLTESDLSNVRLVDICHVRLVTMSCGSGSLVVGLRGGQSCSLADDFDTRNISQLAYHHLVPMLLQERGVAVRRDQSNNSLQNQKRCHLRPDLSAWKIFGLSSRVFAAKRSQP